MTLLELTRSEKREQEKSRVHTHLSESVTLGDGITVTIRPIHADDAPHLQAICGRLSPASIFFSFLGVGSEPYYRQVERLANVDHQTHMALMATREQHGKEYAVALAHYWVIPAHNTDLTEAAIVIVSWCHIRELETLLLKRLTAPAQAHDIGTLLTTVQLDNVRITRIIRRNGLPIKSSLASGNWEIRMILETQSDH